MLKNFIRSKLPSLYYQYQQLKIDRNYKYMLSLNENEYPNELRKLYKKRTGQDLNLAKPTSYTEKMQWAKLYEVNPIKTRLTDKYLVREWVAEKIGKEYLVPLLGVWNMFDEIEFEELPSKFVLKANNGSGTNIIVKDKEKFDYKKAKSKFEKWLNTDFAYINGFELQYRGIEPKIIAEKYLEDNSGELNDYKFLCFGGKVYYCWVDIGRFTDHRRNIYDLNWELQEWKLYYENTNDPIPKPKNFELMIELATKLCQGFSHVRIDFYNTNGKIYFGEMTFTSESGFLMIKPDEYNLMLGNLWEIDLTDK